MPSRIDSLEQVVDAIYWQVDNLYVYLNNFEFIPSFLNRPNIIVHRSQDHGDLKDVGKFFSLQYIKNGYFLSLDDDIEYPIDYAAKMIDVLERSVVPSVVGVHGVILPRFPRSFFERRVFPFKKSLDHNVPVSFLGTGTCAFDVSKVNIPFSIFNSYGMADLHLGAYLKRIGVPAIAISRPDGWLKEIGTGDAEHDSLYQRTRHSPEPHNMIIRSNSPWGEQDLLQRGSKLLDSEVLSGQINYALSIISACALNRGDILEVPEGVQLDRPLVQTMKYLEYFADPDTLEVIYSKIIRYRNTPLLRTMAIEGLFNVNIEASILNSRRMAGANPDSANATLRHAELCARAELQEEAKNHYVLAARMATRYPGTKGVHFGEILFKYFVFLINNLDFKEAEAASLLVAKTHHQHSLYKRGMFLIAVSQGDYSSANSYLSAFLRDGGARAKRYRRELIILLLKAASFLNLDTELELDPACIFNASNASSDLIDLLKITVLLGDHSGAAACWSVLSKRFSSVVCASRELQWFYHSNIGGSDELSLMTAGRGNAGLGWATNEDYSIFKEVASLGKSTKKNKSSEQISVIMTSYNSEKTISYAIDSILNQTHANLELIVVDDFSSDQTCAVVERYMTLDPRIKLIKNTKNCGPYISRNVGIAHSSGPFIAIHDADDAALPDRLALQREAFTGGTVAVLGSHLRFDSSGCVALENDGSILGHGPMTLIFARHVIDELGSFAEVRTRGDKEFESRLENFYGAHTVKRLSDVVTLSLHSHDSNSHTHTKSADLRHDLMRFKQNYSRQHAAGRFKAEV